MLAFALPLFLRKSNAAASTSLQVLKSIRTAIICICAITRAAAQQPPAPEPRPATIVGTVVDFKGGVVPGATVVLEGQDRNEDRRVVTQNNGFFKLDGVKPGVRYHVGVEARGFAKWTSGEITVTPGQYFILKGINLRIASVQVTVSVVPKEEIAVQQYEAQVTQRVFSVLPNFYVAYNQNAVPLTSKLKFKLATKFLTDPVTMAGFVLNASIYQVTGYPSYPQNAKGYGQRLGATFVGGYTNIFVGDAILPSLLHQDPRYFYQGTGSTKSRLMHALSSPFVIRGDDGSRQFNFSDFGGDLASGAIANAYYPDKDRGARLLRNSVLIGIAGRAINATFQEFVLRKFTHGRDLP